MLPTGTPTSHPHQCPCSVMSPPYRPMSSSYRPRWSLHPHFESLALSSSAQRTAWDPVPRRGSVLQATAALPRRRVGLIRLCHQRLRQRERRGHLADDQTKNRNPNAENLNLQSVRANGQTAGRSWNQRGPENTWRTREQNRKSVNVGLGASASNASNAANPGQRASDEAGGLSEAVKGVAK